MNKYDYFRYALRERLTLDMTWINRVFMLIIDSTEHHHLRKQNGEFLVMMDGEWVSLGKEGFDKPLFNVDEYIDLKKGDLKCLGEDVTTTIGIALANSIVYDYGMSNKLPYVNGEITIGAIEDILLEKMIDNPSDGNFLEDVLYVRDREQLSKAELRLREFAYIFTVARTKRTLLPPPDLKAKAKVLLKEMKAKYGDKLFKDERHGVEYVDTLKEYYIEYLKDDPSYGIVLSKKIMNQSLPKRHIAFGYTKSDFDDTLEIMILSTLSDGMDMSEDVYAAFVNTSRAGSLFRGVSTQQSGTIAKNLVLATMSLKYVDGNCGSKVGLPLLLDDPNSYKNRYHIYKGKLIPLDIGTFKGKRIELRDPMHCLSPAGSYCGICSGDNYMHNKKSIVLQSTKFGGNLLNGDMKKMHGKDAKTVLLAF